MWRLRIVIILTVYKENDSDSYKKNSGKEKSVQYRTTRGNTIAFAIPFPQRPIKLNPYI